MGASEEGLESVQLLSERRCFGLLGTANFKISHALVQAGVEFISARHEGNATSMADAYAKATEELTLVSVHSGPGLTNAITGIGEAVLYLAPQCFSIEICGTVATVAPIDPFFGASLQHSAARNVSLEPPGSLTQVELVGKELRRYVCNPENSTEQHRSGN